MTAPPVLGGLDPEAPAPFGPRSIVRAMVAEPVTALLVQRAQSRRRKTKSSYMNNLFFGDHGLYMDVMRFYG